MLRWERPPPLSLLSTRPGSSIKCRTVAPLPTTVSPPRVSNMSMDLNFHIGDKVVYPNHGVGVIEQISSRSVGATVEKFYLLHIKASSLKVMVPCQNAGSVGLRRVVRNGEIQKVLDALSIGENGSNGDWKDRFKENSERMRTGSLL